MHPYFIGLKDSARRLADGLPPPAFYTDHREPYQESKRFFDTDPTVADIRNHARGELDEAMGHGWHHAVTVSIDAGCLLLVEARRLDRLPGEEMHLLRLTQCAGLLHDIRRRKKQHASAGADASERLLPAYGFASEDIRRICDAIRNHVAFRPIALLEDPATRLIADCLYDADKFRWGPDNFTHTVWDMVSFAAIRPEAFAKRYRKGVAFLKTIADTFRTRTGKAYGPEFIDQGLTIARGLESEVLRGTASGNENTGADR
jgi:hypothetical protein